MRAEARLVAQKPFNAVRHEPLLPTPDAGLGHARLAHDRRGADPRGRQKDNLAAAVGGFLAARGYASLLDAQRIHYWSTREEALGALWSPPRRPT